MTETEFIYWLRGYLETPIDNPHLHTIRENLLKINAPVPVMPPVTIPWYPTYPDVIPQWPQSPYYWSSIGNTRAGRN